MSELQGQVSGVFTYLILRGPINTTLTFPVFTGATLARNSLFGLVSSSFAKDFDNQMRYLRKQKYGPENFTKATSGGQTQEVTFNMNELAKDDIKKVLNDNADFSASDPLDATNGYAGTLEFNNEAGRGAVPYRYIFVPTYENYQTGSFINGATNTTDKEMWIEFPEAVVTNSLQIENSESEFATYEVTLKKRAGESVLPVKFGSEIELAIT